MSGSLGKYLRWLWSYSKGVRQALVWNVVLGIGTVGLNLLFIWLCKSLVDIATGNIQGNIYLYSGIILLVVVMRLAFSAISLRLENVTLAKLNFNIRSSLYSNLMQSRWMGRDDLHSGDTLNRLMSDVDKVADAICSELPSFVTTLFQIVAAFVFFCLLQWELAVVLILLIPAFMAFSKLFFRKMRVLTSRIRSSESKVQSHIQESLQHKTVVQSMETGEFMQDRLDSLQEVEYGQILDRTRFNIFARTMVGAAFNIGYIIAFLWGVFGIWKGSITFGVMTAFLQLVGQIQGPAVRLTRQVPAFANATASIDRLMALENSPKEEKGDPVVIPGVAGIRLENVTFRYDGEGRYIFKDFSFDFPPGSRTAIVGETGVGKSTMVRLMMALLEPQQGKVVLYGNGREAVASALTRRNLVYVPQGNSLFSGTIRDNLRLGDPEACEDDMKRVLEIAAAEFVFDLPDGLDTVCGEGGTGLSEGQAQRIAIARGLLRPGSILLLDEFSSSLDPDTEDRLMRNLIAGKDEKTMVFITHRQKISEFCKNTLSLER
ncbi:MAG: ABC transporter ATP-binding protein [Bacteroidales bacterium]|nr:ABC transporter ATP-binding protein [Bacteroidales bacterium]MBQ5944041.1 ABC transporter ATP-binding protein [Bacteroidales bacterium]